MTEHDWFLAHHLKEGTDPDEEEEEEEDEDEETEGPKSKDIITITPMPVIENPGYFVIKDSWKVETTILRKCEEHSQNFQSLLWKTNIEQTVNLQLTDTIHKSLLSDHTGGEGTITANIKLILAHMEETYDKIYPKDIGNIMKTFTADFDGTTTVSTYFDPQQNCQKLIRTTKEPILAATMIRTSLGNFQRLPPYISKACKEWEEFEQEQENDD